MNKGFTLVELIIVVAILAILVGLLAPQYSKYVEKARKTADINNLNESVNAIKIAAVDPDYNLGSSKKPKTYYDICIGSHYQGASTTYNGTILRSFNCDEGNDSIIRAIHEYAGIDFIQESSSDNVIKYKNETLKMKSKSWGMPLITRGGNKEPIAKVGVAAQVILDNSTGTVNVIYSDNVANYLDHGTIE